MSAAPQDIPVITDSAVVAIVERASDLDRTWFRRHPDRAHRIRRMIPGEHPPEVLAFGPQDWPVFTLVKQISPGCRMRVPFKFRQTPASSESCLAAIWEQYASVRTKQIALDMAAAMLGRRA